jgi:hypothetical protein
MLHRPLYKLLGRFLSKHDRRRLSAKILFQDSFQYGIQNARFINSRSILFSCNVHPSNPASSQANLLYLQDIPSQVHALDKNESIEPHSIYLPSDGLEFFVKHVLGELDKPFILVSGDSDMPISFDSLGESLKEILESPLIVSWYAQNRDFDHPKLKSLPIGINIHNLWANPLQWGGGFILPTLQELQLETIALNAPPHLDRIPKIFCNWHFSIDRADRNICFDTVDKSLCFFQPEPLPVSNTWQIQSQYQFVLSPHGAGLDCHRTWEALLLGCIVIVKNAKLNDLFNDLPVITIDDWSEITPSFLDRSMSMVNAKKINTEKLYMQYWKSKINPLEHKPKSQK